MPAPLRLEALIEHGAPEARNGPRPGARPRLSLASRRAPPPTPARRAPETLPPTRSMPPPMPSNGQRKIRNSSDGGRYHSAALTFVRDAAATATRRRPATARPRSMRSSTGRERRWRCRIAAARRPRRISSTDHGRHPLTAPGPASGLMDSFRIDDVDDHPAEVGGGRPMRRRAARGRRDRPEGQVSRTRRATLPASDTSPEPCSAAPKPANGAARLQARRRRRVCLARAAGRRQRSSTDSPAPATRNRATRTAPA